MCLNLRIGALRNLTCGVQISPGLVIIMGGEVVHGDLAYDGRVIIYIINGLDSCRELTWNTTNDISL